MTCIICKDKFAAAAPESERWTKYDQEMYCSAPCKKVGYRILDAYTLRHIAAVNAATPEQQAEAMIQAGPDVGNWVREFEAAALKRKGKP